MFLDRCSEKNFPFAVFILVGCMTVFLIGCDFIYGLIDEDGAQEKELVGEVVLLEQNPKVKEIQELLDIYGYDPGEPDGILGKKTRDAISAFQEDAGLKVSRFVDDETWRQLTVFRSYQLIVDNKLNIRLVQEILTAAGYKPGKPDGKYGGQTKEAVMQFQKDAGLKADGKIGYKTLSRLSEYLVLE